MYSLRNVGGDEWRREQSEMERMAPLNEKERARKRAVGTESARHVHIG